MNITSNRSKELTFILAASLFISSCSSIPVAQVNQRINNWKSASINQLIQFWGLPSNQRQVGEKHYAEWLNKSSEAGNTSVSIGGGSRGRSGGIGLGLTLFELGGSDDVCSRLVTYNSEGIIEAISWQGSQNYCYELTPNKTQVEAAQAARQKESN